MDVRTFTRISPISVDSGSASVRANIFIHNIHVQILYITVSNQQFHAIKRGRLVNLRSMSTQPSSRQRKQRKMVSSQLHCRYSSGDQCCVLKQRRLMLRMRFREQQFSQKTIPKLVRTRERSTASWAPLQVVVY